MDLWLAPAPNISVAACLVLEFYSNLQRNSSKHQRLILFLLFMPFLPQFIQMYVSHHIALEIPPYLRHLFFLHYAPIFFIGALEGGET